METALKIGAAYNFIREEHFGLPLWAWVLLAWGAALWIGG